MARKVFYSFHYQNDINRVMVVRNRWVTYGNQLVSGVIDHADFEQVQKQGDFAIKKWINSQMEGTTATIVLIGAETLHRPYVQYEICQSINRGNAIVGVYINRIANFTRNISNACPRHTVIGEKSGRPLYFDEVADGIYDYVTQNGYKHLDLWVEYAVTCHK